MIVGANHGLGPLLLSTAWGYGVFQKSQLVVGVTRDGNNEIVEKAIATEVAEGRCRFEPNVYDMAVLANKMRYEQFRLHAILINTPIMPDIVGARDADVIKENGLDALECARLLLPLAAPNCRIAFVSNEVPRPVSAPLAQYNKERAQFLATSNLKAFVNESTALAKGSYDNSRTALDAAGALLAGQLHHQGSDATVRIIHPGRIDHWNTLGYGGLHPESAARLVLDQWLIQPITKQFQVYTATGSRPMKLKFFN